MKILFIAHSGEISGGANRSLLTLMTGLREQYAVSSSVLIPEKNTPLEKRCKAVGIPVYTARHHTCCTVFHRTPKDLLRAAKLLLAPMLDRLEAKRLNHALPADFDLYYTNDRMICVGGYLAHLRGKPHVWHAAPRLPPAAGWQADARKGPGGRAAGVGCPGSSVRRGRISVLRRASACL